MEAGNNHGKEKRLSDDTRMKISELEGWMKHRTFRRWVLLSFFCCMWNG
jgi:hypothetical protein